MVFSARQGTGCPVNEAVLDILNIFCIGKILDCISPFRVNGSYILSRIIFNISIGKLDGKLRKVVFEKSCNIT